MPDAVERDNRKKTKQKQEVSGLIVKVSLLGYKTHNLNLIWFKPKPRGMRILFKIGLYKTGITVIQ